MSTSMDKQYCGKQANNVETLSTNDRSSNQMMRCITSLPDVVTTHICKFLDVSGLMNLRLTCSKLKVVVEQATVLENLPIKITSSKQLQRVLESRVPFNNITLSFRCLEEQTYLREFAEKFGPFMKMLKITTGGGYPQTFHLLENCLQLKELAIEVVNASTYKKSGRLEKILNNLRGLRKLTIHNVVALDGDEQEEINIFLSILNNCKFLVEFTVPAIYSYNEKLTQRRQERMLPNENLPANNAPSDDEDWEQNAIQYNYNPFPEWDKNDTQDILFSSIFKYICLRVNMKFPRLRRINVGNISNFERKTFKDLLHVCYENDISLMGIKGTQLLDFISDATIFNRKYGGVIGSANFYSFNLFPYDILENIKTLDLFISTSFGKESASNSDLFLPRLKTLNVQFVWSVNSKQTQKFIQQLFRASDRPTVERLQLDWSLNEKHFTVSAKDLINNFGNLKELDLREWGAIDSEFRLLWTNLLKLEKITIIHCKNLTNRAFVGDYNLNDDRNIVQRPLNRLKKLKSLTVHDVTGKVNEIALMGSFRWIKLQFFEFRSTTILELREDAYRALMVSPLGRSVEYLFVPKPTSESFFLKKRALKKGFKNLKRRVRW